MTGPPRLIDSHCHLSAPQFDGDRADVLARAAAAGVSCVVDVGTEPEDWEHSRSLAHQYDSVYCVLGLHPNSAAQWNEALEHRLRLLLRHGRVVGVGETGLDYFRLGAPPEVQERVFAAHLGLGRELDLPVVIHARDAYDDVLRVIAQHGAGTRGVMHSFAGSVEQAQRAVELGYYISLSGPVTYKSGRALRDVAASVPGDRLLVETDSPYLPPHPHRGQRNEPAYAVLTLQAVAQARSISVDQAASMTYANTVRLFGLPWGRSHDGSS